MKTGNSTDRHRVLSPRGDSREVLLEFTNLGGWPTDGLAAMVGIITPLSIWIGYECPVHMAEEVHDASRNLPKSILGAVALNGLLSFIMAMTLMFCVGDAEAVLAAADDYNGYAFLAIFQNAVSNPHALNMMVFLVIFGFLIFAASNAHTKAVTCQHLFVINLNILVLLIFLRLVGLRSGLVNLPLLA